MLITIISGIMVISAKNPVHSVLYLIFVFINSTALLINLGTDFIGLLLLRVYIGAVAMLFLFVVMMVNIKIIEFNENSTRFIPVGIIIGIVFLLQVLSIITPETITKPTNKE
jgi:NADH-quinone oxidoreductase subunit J